MYISDMMYSDILENKINLSQHLYLLKSLIYIWFAKSLILLTDQFKPRSFDSTGNLFYVFQASPKPIFDNENAIQVA